MFGYTRHPTLDMTKHPTRSTLKKRVEASVTDEVEWQTGYANNCRAFNLGVEWQSTPTDGYNNGSTNHGEGEMAANLEQ